MSTKRSDSAKARRAAARYRYDRETYRTFLVRVRRDGRDGLTWDRVERAAKRDGLSVNAWVLSCLRECL